MSNFIDDNLTLPADKIDLNPVTDATHQVAADDINRIFQALKDTRTVVQRGWINVKSFGVTGDGVTDDSVAIQTMIMSTVGRVLYFPAGKYKITSTITIADRGRHFVGDIGIRANVGGTEFMYTGTGPCIQIGNDDHNAWDANEYNGPQDQVFENIWFSHGAPNTALVAANLGSTFVYKAGAYGMWDWRGGQIVLNRCGFEAFEANFVGVNSDINNFNFVVSMYSKYGIYLGPRSDQCSIRDLYALFCDRAVTIDRAGKCRILQAQLVGCGTSTTAAIEVRQGSYDTEIQGPWCEHGQGYQGTDQLSFVSAGEVQGYGAGGSIQAPGGTPTTTAVIGLEVFWPTILGIIAGQPAHTKYLISVGKCQQLVLDHPVAQPGSALTNFDALIGVPNSGINPTNADTQIEARGIPSTLALAKIYTNLSSGSPNVTIDASGSSGRMFYSTSRFHFLTPGASAGADDIELSQEGVVGDVWLITPNKPSGQITRARFSRSFQPGVSAAAPTTLVWEQGDVVYVTDPAVNGFSKWVCVTGGTPGTWVKEGLMTDATGKLTLPNGSAIGTSTANVTTLTGQLAVVPGTGTTGINSNNSVAAQTATNACVKGLQNGTYDTTAGFISAIGMQGQAVATRSAGANTLQNIGGQFTASGAQDNVAIQTVNGDVQLNTTAGATVINKSFRCLGEITAASISADQTNYQPTGIADAGIVTMSATTPVNINGFGGFVTGKFMYVYNRGANAITLKHNTGSVAIVGRGNADTVLTTSTGALLYASVSGSWIILGDTL